MGLAAHVEADLSNWKGKGWRKGFEHGADVDEFVSIILESKMVYTWWLLVPGCGRVKMVLLPLRAEQSSETE